MTRVILMALLLSGCRALSPETERVIEKDLSQLEIDMMQAQLDSMKTTPETH